MITAHSSTTHDYYDGIYPSADIIMFKVYHKHKGVFMEIAINCVYSIH